MSWWTPKPKPAPKPKAKPANGLTKADYGLIIASLSFTRDKFEGYEYPSEDLRQERLDDVREASANVRAVGQRLRHESLSRAN